MTNKELENKLARAMDHAVPDVLDQVLQACAEPKGADEQMEQQNFTPRKKHRTPLIVAASLAIAACGVLAGWQMHAATVPVARVALDVNPSVEFSLDRRDRVRDVTACNADAEQLLTGLELEKKSMNEAVDLLMTAFADNGYLQQQNGAVLITVDAKNGKEDELQQKLTTQVKDSMSAHELTGNVLSQKVSADQELAQKAQEWHTSFGRAAFYETLGLAANVDPAQLNGLTVQQMQALTKLLGLSMEDAGLDPMFSQMPLDDDLFDDKDLDDILQQHLGYTDAQMDALEDQWEKQYGDRYDDQLDALEDQLEHKYDKDDQYDDQLDALEDQLEHQYGDDDRYDDQLDALEDQLEHKYDKHDKDDQYEDQLDALEDQLEYKYGDDDRYEDQLDALEDQLEQQYDRDDPDDWDDDFDD